MRALNRIETCSHICDGSFSRFHSGICAIQITRSGAVHWSTTVARNRGKRVQTSARDTMAQENHAGIDPTTFTFESSAATHQCVPIEWTVTYTKPSTGERKGAKGYFEDLNVSCRERHNAVFVKALSISLVHGAQEWDLILSDDYKEVAWDQKQDERILLYVLEPMAQSIVDGLHLPVLNHTTTASAHWNAVEFRIDRLDMSYNAESQQCIDCQVSGIAVRFRDDQGVLVYAATIPESFSIAPGTPFLSIESVNIIIGDVESVQSWFAVTKALLESSWCNVQISSIGISTEDGWMSGMLTDLVSESTGSIMCGHASVTFRDGSIFSLAGLSFTPSAEFITIESLDTCYIPGLCSLSRTVPNLRMSLGLDKMTVFLLGTHVILLRNLTHEGLPWQWPLFPSISILSENLTLERHGKILLELMDCQIDAIASDKGAEFHISCGKLCSRMISTRNSSVSGCFAYDTVHDLRIRPGEVSIVSDLMTFDWSLICSQDLKDGYQGSILKIPNGMIESFSLRVDFQEALLIMERPHTFPSFLSGPTATSRDFGDYVVKLFVNELPQLYVKTRVMGERATDLTAKAAGRLASSYVALSAIGSVGALVLTDAMRACSKLSLPSILEKREQLNSTSGQGSSDGMLEQLKEYLMKNRTRFGAAAGSTFGIAIGAAFYGLPGMMFGNLVGGKMASTALGNGCTVVSEADDKISLCENSDVDWVFVDVSGEKDPKGRQRPLQHEVLWTTQRCTPSAPFCQDASTGYQQESSDRVETIPVYLVPATSVKKGYLPWIQKSFFLILRRGRLENT